MVRPGIERDANDEPFMGNTKVEEAKPFVSSANKQHRLRGPEPLWAGPPDTVAWELAGLDQAGLHPRPMRLAARCTRSVHLPGGGHQRRYYPGPKAKLSGHITGWKLVPPAPRVRSGGLSSAADPEGGSGLAPSPRDGPSGIRLAGFRAP